MANSFGRRSINEWENEAGEFELRILINIQTPLTRGHSERYGGKVTEVFPLRLETTLKLLFIAANFEGEWLDARRLYVHFTRIKRSFFAMNFFPVWSNGNFD